MLEHRRVLVAGLVLLLLVGLISGCATTGTSGRTTSHDKTGKGAAIGAGVGAVLGALLGEGEADEILAGAAIGAGIGAGVGAYMDRQEEKLARIPGTTILALMPVLTSSGRGADVMLPMAIPSFGGMAVELITMFVVPTLYAIVQERRVTIGGGR